MISTLDFLHLVLAFCAIAVTVVLVVLGMESIRIVRDVRRISQNVEHMTSLVDRVASLVVPGVAHMAKGAGEFQESVGDFLHKKAKKIAKF
jgi:hypothetical protein